MEIVRRAAEAFKAGGVEALVPFLAPGAVLHPAPEWIEAPEYHGPDGLRALVSVWTDYFDEWVWEIHELRDAGDRVVALIEHGGKIKGTDTPLHQPMGIIYSDFRGGQIGGARFFQTWREALEAAGLQE